MTNIIDILERMGRDANLRHASQGDLELALASDQIDLELRAAIIAKDQQRVEDLLVSRPYCCLLFPEKEGEDDDSEESPSRDGEEIAAFSALNAIASVG